MFVNGIPYLYTFSQNIRLITCKYVPTSTAEQLAKSLMEIVNVYPRGGFVNFLVLMDMVFEKVKEKVGLVEVNTTAAQERVTDI